MRIIESLEEYDKEKQKEEKERMNNVHEYLLRTLYNMEKENKSPQLITDTTISRVAEFHSLKEREAVKLLNEIISKDEFLENDGTVIKFKWWMLTCKCGSKYSSKLDNCPSCNQKFYNK